MWLQLGIASGALVLLVAVVTRALRLPKRIDLGSVSDAWLAEQRTRRDE